MRKIHGSLGFGARALRRDRLVLMSADGDGAKDNTLPIGFAINPNPNPLDVRPQLRRLRGRERDHVETIR